MRTSSKQGKSVKQPFWGLMEIHVQHHPTWTWASPLRDLLSVRLPRTNRCFQVHGAEVLIHAGSRSSILLHWIRETSTIWKTHWLICNDQISPQEGQAMTAIFDSPQLAFTKGVTAAGTKYLASKADERSIYCKRVSSSSYHFRKTLISLEGGNRFDCLQN